MSDDGITIRPTLFPPSLMHIRGCIPVVSETSALEYKMIYNGAIFDNGQRGGSNGDSGIVLFDSVVVVLPDEDMLNPSAILLKLVLMHEREVQERQELLKGLAPFMQWGSAGSGGDDALVMMLASLLSPQQQEQ